MKGEKSNVAKPIPLRQDLMKTYRQSALMGWIVSFILLVVVIGLSIFIAVRPTPLSGIDENGFVVGQVIFDEPRLRSSEEVLADMKNLIRRCLTTSKQTVWEDIAVCINHLQPDIADKRMKAYEESGELLQIDAYGCDRVEFTFDTKGTGIIKHERHDYMAEGQLSGTVACNDSKNPDFLDFKVNLSVLLRPRTDKLPFGIEVYSYEDI